MQSESNTSNNATPTHFLPRKVELEALASALPIRGVDVNSNRVFNIWGDREVGKTSFVSELRESEFMLKSKVLWIQPTRDGSLDTIPEFIRSCSQTIRYPAEPEKEKKIAQQIESVERGKVNPIISDDSLLITRSSIAKQKKPYVNQAAAASVGRTEIVRDDVEINVGLGESKATNHAEGFLDALPLQSLGTDLTIIYIEKFDRLSVTIVDWLRDYVFPAATRGAYRRSLVFLFESLDPLKLAYPNETWGDWSNLTEDIQMYPFCDDDVYKIGLASGLEPGAACYLQHKSLGYPKPVTQSIPSLKTLDRSAASTFLDSLPDPYQLKVAALALPESLYPEDLDVLFGPKQGAPTLDWFQSLPNNLSRRAANDTSLVLSDALRCEAISRFHKNPEFAEYVKRWNPMGRFIRNIPSRNDRSKLLLLSGLFWIDSDHCKNLFGEQSDKILPFVTERTTIFNRFRERYRISERIRSDLQKTAQNLNHPGVGVVLKKASKLWEETKEELSIKIAKLESLILVHQGEINALSRRKSETQAQIRIHERATDESGPASHHSSFLPKWLRFGDSEGQDDSSPASLKHLGMEIRHKIQEHEVKLDELQAELAVEKEALKYPLV